MPEVAEGLNWQSLGHLEYMARCSGGVDGHPELMRVLSAQSPVALSAVAAAASEHHAAAKAAAVEAAAAVPPDATVLLAGGVPMSAAAALGGCQVVRWERFAGGEAHEAQEWPSAPGSLYGAAVLRVPIGADSRRRCGGVGAQARRPTAAVWTH